MKMNAYAYEHEDPVHPFEDEDARPALSMRAMLTHALGLAGSAVAMLMVVAHALHATA